MSLDSLAYVREAPEPEEAPPMLSSGALAWARANLFSSIGSTFVTVGCVALVAYLLPQLVAWAMTRAIWSASDGAACRQHQDGACWAFVIAKWDYLRFGSYPVAERWRVDLVEAVGALLIVWLLWTNAPRRAWALSCSLSPIRSWPSFFCAVHPCSVCRSSIRCCGEAFSSHC